MNRSAIKKESDDRRVARISLPDTYEGQQLVVSNDLVAANYRLSLTQLRLVWMFGMLIRKADEDFRHYQVSINEVIRYLGLNARSGKVYEQIEEAVEGLLGNVLHVPRRDSDGWLKFAWVSSAEYRGRDGTIEFEFSEKLKPFLLRLTGNFTVAELSQIMRLRSVYSGRIYLLLKQYRKIGKIRLSLDRLRLLLSLDVIGDKGSSAPYARYQDFRRYVLEQAQRELAEKTDLSFEYVPIKKGRKIREIEFLIRAGVQNNMALSPSLPGDVPLVIKHLVEIGFTETHAARLWTKGWKSVPADIRDTIGGDIDFETYVLEKLTLLKKALRKGVIDNPVGWLVKAVRENWVDKSSARPRVRRNKRSQGVLSVANLLKEKRFPKRDHPE